MELLLKTEKRSYEWVGLGHNFEVSHGTVLAKFCMLDTFRTNFVDSSSYPYETNMIWFFQFESHGKLKPSFDISDDQNLTH